ncbi:MAG: hypothetical protein JKY99_12130, partial [Rhizobiales bacterium]|nr:hypothetical protein [Hyphomicrobiales bacterium]
RCQYKIVGLCDEIVPPVQTLSDDDTRVMGHQIMCHLSSETLRNMEPVFKQKEPEPAE